MPKQYTISEAARIIKDIQEEKDELFQTFKKDERKGIQKLISKWYSEREQETALREEFVRMSSFENELKHQGFRFIAGIDEVGRGPLAGPVVAAAVILPQDICLLGINDSKKLSEKQRETFYELITDKAIAWGTGIISAEEIDRLNIYQASKKAMITAVNGLGVYPDHLLIDAMELGTPFPEISLIKGDARSISIAAASIVAKVTRDRLMEEYAQDYPGYGFQKNMGYGTKEHLEGLKQYGPCPIHRSSFAPVKELMLK
ncbi:ribonuclease HII [Rossellomorea vietnamensis]|uniref:Ribonuclease HII n=1 Tax=Rossellomorea vietnamensis TaxID=218284 RepID=A0A5D4NRN4_9BACI|nr:ribonuclease HII [Rossellomorea vietnamensis]TYS16304.1 ribonuclease HII [Rossellomorea vietnamensis]